MQSVLPRAVCSERHRRRYPLAVVVGPKLTGVGERKGVLKVVEIWAA